ncbi:MAG: biotin--[acetyl-CoA-carboxylase] ligase [Anaerolineales bacterium]|nr:biotin--[acetyl-CoA-carboxylase] ligase [Anaerolineales bacterium]
MMHQDTLRQMLQGLALGETRYFEQVGSSNDLAAEWAGQGAPDRSLVIAGEQLSGRGRLARRWFSPPETSLAFSLILKPQPTPPSEHLLRYTGLGALAVCQALQVDYRLPASIKWPNDVLINGKKVCGVLLEAHWSGAELQALILGVGVNVGAGAVPPQQAVTYPATSLETELGQRLGRWQVLRQILLALTGWLARLPEPAFIQAWEQNLAFRGQQVQVTTAGQVLWHGRLLGLSPAGQLRLEMDGGEQVEIISGEIPSPVQPFSLRPVDSSGK